MRKLIIIQWDERNDSLLFTTVGHYSNNPIYAASSMAIGRQEKCFFSISFYQFAATFQESFHPIMVVGLFPWARQIISSRMMMKWVSFLTLTLPPSHLARTPTTTTTSSTSSSASWSFLSLALRHVGWLSVCFFQIITFFLSMFYRHVITESKVQKSFSPSLTSPLSSPGNSQWWCHECSNVPPPSRFAKLELEKPTAIG